MQRKINPRPGVVVAIASKDGEIALSDPSAYRRRDYLRNERVRQEKGEGQWESEASQSKRCEKTRGR